MRTSDPINTCEWRNYIQLINKYFKCVQVLSAVHKSPSWPRERNAQVRENKQVWITVPQEDRVLKVGNWGKIKKKTIHRGVGSIHGNTGMWGAQSLAGTGSLTLSGSEAAGLGTVTVTLSAATLGDGLPDGVEGSGRGPQKQLHCWSGRGQNVPFLHSTLQSHWLPCRVAR